PPWWSTTCGPSTRQPPPSGILPSFLTSTWSRSPAFGCSYRSSVRREARIRTPVTGSSSDSRGSPALAINRDTVDGLTPVCWAISSRPRRSCCRSDRTVSTTAPGVALGDRFGRDGRSSNPPEPSKRKPSHPTVSALPRDAELLRDMRHRTTRKHPLHQDQATGRSEPRITVDQEKASLE